MSRRWRRRVSAKQPIRLEFEGLVLMLQPTTPKSKAEALALAGPADIFGRNAFEAAKAAADGRGVDLDRMLFLLSEDDPEAYRAIHRFIGWMGEVRICNAATHVNSIEMDGVVHMAPAELDARRAWFGEFEATDDDGDVDYEARNAMLDAIEAALSGSTLDPEGKD